MHTEGSFAPSTEAAARDRYETLGPIAQRVVREVARAMELSAEEYDRRVTNGVVETAREVLFAAELEVHVGDRAAYEEWVGRRGFDVSEFGSENVANVAWHGAPFAERVVATTFQDEPDAAVETCRRQALGEVYRDVVR